MKKMGLSVIIPVYNSKEWIGPTLNHLFTALQSTRFDAEIIVVDDGSTDGSADAVRSITTPKQIPVVLIEQENTGRYIARKNGVSAASKENILFVDSRVYVDEGALKYLESELKVNPDQIWNGHVNIDKKGNIFARFWDAVVGVAWRRYFRKPKRTSFGIEDFDYYPKGTGFFYVPKKRLLAAMRYFEKHTNDLRHSSDDTLLIRYLAERQAINLSPQFSCLYHGRSNLKGFLKHAYFRGQFFIDGFLRKGTRFYYPLLAVLVGSITGAVLLSLFLPGSLLIVLALAVVFISVLFIGAIVLGVSVADAAALSILSLPFAVVYLAGLWRGFFRKLAKLGFKGFFNLIWSILRKQRRILRGSIGEYIAATILYLGVAVLLTKSVLFHLTDQIYASIGDATAGFMWLNFAEPGLDLLPSYTDDVNYPVGERVGGPTFIAYMAIWIPMRLISNVLGPVAAVNIVMYIGYVGAALAAYWLLKRLTGNAAVAFFAGLATAFTPYAMYKSSAHIAYIFSGVFVLILGAFIGIVKRPTVLRSILLAAAIALAFYTDGYYILLASVMVAGLVVAGLLYGLLRRFSLKDYLLRIKHLLLALLVLVLMLTPLAITQLMKSDEVKNQLTSSRSAIEPDMYLYRSNIIDFMLPSQHHPVLEDNAQFARLHSYKNQRSNPSENMSYLGFALIILAAIGALLLLVRTLAPRYSSLKLMREEIDNFTLVFLVGIVTIPLFLSFMFSPNVSVAGVVINLPGQFFIDYDINLWRVMSRFFVPLHVVLAVLASIGLYLLFKVVSRRRGRKILGYVVVAVCTIFMMFEFAANIPNRPYSFSKNMPSAYARMAQQSDIKVVAELPFVDPLDERTAGYVSAQIIHGKKLVNMKDPNPARLSNILGSDINIETLNFLRERQVDTVITRGSGCSEEQWGILRFQSDLESKDTPKLCVYQLRQLPLNEVDDAFIVYGKGFNPSPNAPDQSEVVLNDNEAFFQVKEADLQTDFKDIKNGVTISGVLKNNSDRSFQWVLLAGETIIQQGTTASGSESAIVVTVQYNDIKLVLKDENYALSEATFADVRVDEL